MAQQVAGDRFTVETLVPEGVDPHGYEPAPSDLRAAAEADLVLVNGGGLEGSLEATLREAGAAPVVAVSQGLASRAPAPGEPPLGDGEQDPHFWLDPVLGRHYVERIEAAFSRADPDGASLYAANAQGYLKELDELDARVGELVAAVPQERRVLVTDHASQGYFADRYGFRIVGTVLPGASSGLTPSARQLAGLVATIRREQVRAVFVEAGEDPSLARQVAAETGVQVVDGLLDHSLTGPGGPAPTYIAMIEHNARTIVEALR